MDHKEENKKLRMELLRTKTELTQYKIENERLTEKVKFLEVCLDSKQDKEID